MVMKVRSFWKVLIGMVVSLFVGGGMTAKADAKAKPTSKKVTVAQAPEARGSYVSPPTRAFPTSGVAEVRFPSTGSTVGHEPGGVATMCRPADAEGVATMCRPADAEGVATMCRPADAEGVATTARPVDVEGAELWMHPTPQGAASYTVTLPEFDKAIQIISNEQAHLPGYKDKPVIIMDKQECTGYLRIPVTLPVSEDTLRQEYKKH